MLPGVLGHIFLTRLIAAQLRQATRTRFHLKWAVVQLSFPPRAFFKAREGHSVQVQVKLERQEQEGSAGAGSAGAGSTGAGS